MTTNEQRKQTEDMLAELGVWTWCDLEDAPNGEGWLYEVAAEPVAEVMDDAGSWFWLVTDFFGDVVAEGYEATADEAKAAAEKALVEAAQEAGF